MSVKHSTPSDTSFSPAGAAAWDAGHIGDIGTDITFTPSGSGAQSRSVQSKLREILSFEDFGAVGDGVTDDTVAINLAFAWLRTSVSTAMLPAGFTYGLCGSTGKIYMVGDSINATAIHAITWFLDMRGSVILGRCPGKPVLDFLGSRFGMIYGLNIYGHATDKPTYGIQMGRESVNSRGEFTFVDLRIDGYFTLASYYNYAGEICSFVHCQIWNEDNTSGAYGYVLDAANYQNITSAFVTQQNAQGTAYSCNENTFMDGDIRTNTGGIPCIRIMGNISQFKYQGYLATSTGAAVETYKSTSLRNIEFDCHIETTGVARSFSFDTTNAASNVILTGFRYRDHSPHASNSLIDTTGNTRVLGINGMHLEIGDPANTPVIFGSSYGAANGILCVGVIEWLGNNTLDLSNCQFDGTIITRGTTEVSIVDTVGTYDLIRLPDSVPSRIRLLKGNLRVIGTATGTAPANYADIIGAQTGGAPAITSGGTDTDVDLLLGGQGAGVVKFGTHSNVSTETLTGFITIKDAAGNSRKLGVVS